MAVIDLMDALKKSIESDREQAERVIRTLDDAGHEADAYWLRLVLARYGVIEKEPPSDD